MNSDQLEITCRLLQREPPHELLFVMVNALEGKLPAAKREFITNVKGRPQLRDELLTIAYDILDKYKGCKITRELAYHLTVTVNTYWENHEL